MSATTDVSVDRVLEALAESRRRHAFALLQQHRELALADLAEAVAAEEDDEPLAAVPPERARDVYFSLYHTHVPKLEDWGLVDYEQESDLVTRREEAAEAIERAHAELGRLVVD